MATPAATPLVEDDISLYPSHEEDDVPEGSLHHRWSTYLYNVLHALFPQWFVSGNVCLYWDPHDRRKYVAADTFVADGTVPEPPPRVYRVWLLPEVIWVAEIGSKETAARGPKLGDYVERIRPREILYTDPIDEEGGEVLTSDHIHLYRLSEAGYEAVTERHPSGRIRSEVLGLEIGVDETHNLRLYTLDGEPLGTYDEERERRLEAERGRSEAERHRAAAEERAGREAQEREAAEERARVAERLAAEERRQCEALERRLAELQARLDRGDT